MGLVIYLCHFMGQCSNHVNVLDVTKVVVEADEPVAFAHEQGKTFLKRSLQQENQNK